jgi:hypothetical protein
MFYQGTGKIEVIVRKEGGSASETAVKETSPEEIGDGNNTDWRTSLYGTNNPNRRARIIKTNATHILAVTKQVFDLGLEYYIGGLGDKNGDQSYQQQVQRQVEIVKDVTGFASSIGMGAVYGAWGGPIGAIIGATLGAVTSAASIGSKYMGREREFNYKAFKENNAIEYQRARASINMTTGRLR